MQLNHPLQEAPVVWMPSPWSLAWQASVGDEEEEEDLAIVAGSRGPMEGALPTEGPPKPGADTDSLISGWEIMENIARAACQRWAWSEAKVGGATCLCIEGYISATQRFSTCRETHLHLSRHARGIIADQGDMPAMQNMRRAQSRGSEGCGPKRGVA